MDEENIIQPSTEIQSFLNSGGFFAQQSSISSISDSSNSFFSEQQSSPISSSSQKNMQGIYHDMIRDQNPPELKMMGKINPQEPTDVSGLFKSSTSLTAQQAIQGIGDIKRRTDEIERRQTASSYESSLAANGGGSETSVVNNNNNVTNVTQIVPDYLLGLRQKYGRLPVWREYTG